jgi:hypothetical protein
MVPAVVHAALVTVILWLLTMLATAVGINVTESTLTEIATLIVSYILSLGGLALFKGATRRDGVIGPFDEYHPPFT